MEDVKLNRLWIAYQTAQGDSNVSAKEAFKGVVKNFLMTETEPVAEVPCSAGLDAMLEVVKGIRKSDCGAWLKDCNGIHRCSDGAEKRQELMRLLDRLYKAASI